MVKYCSKCDKSYSDENYKYCPICSAKLEEIDEDIFKIEKLIGLHSNRDIFEIDEENKLLKFKWNGRWISESITRIEEHYQTEYHPYQIPCFIEICSSKDDWDNLLKNDLPDYNKKLSYEQVGYCINAVMAMSINRSNIKPKFITPPVFEDFDADDILNAFKESFLIYGFAEIRKKELYLIFKHEYE